MKLSKIPFEIRIAILYAIFGGLWILMSDALLGILIKDLATYARLQTLKGWIFVAASATLIFYLIRQELIRRAEMDEKLLASEAKYRGLFEHMTEGYAYCKMFFENDRAIDWVYLDVNEAFETLTGLKEAKGKKVSEILPNVRTSDSELFEIYSRVALTGKPEKFEIYLNALKMWFSVSVYSPKEEYFVAVFDVITKRKQAELEIANLSKFPTENPNPVLRVQNDGQVVYANNASQELLEMWGCEVNGYLPVDLRNQISELAKSGIDKSIDISCNDKVYAISLVPVAGSGYVNLYGSDITERKKVEGALRESEERLRQIASSLREVIWLRDIQTRQVLYVNPAFEELTGRTCESFYENRNIVIDAIHPDDREEVIKALDQRSEGVPFDKEHRIIRLDGSVRWVSSRSFPVRNEVGEVYRWASIMEDITERKRAEDELRRTLDDLKRSNAELEQFAYVASHDLQEPLRGIAGMSQLLQKRYQGQLDDRADEYIGHIVDGTQRMQTLINDLLTYSRIGRRGEPIQVTESEAALKATLENLSLAIQEYGAVITNESLPTVQADSTQLIQLFQNLIGNALKFRAEDRPSHIHIGVEEAGEFWQFSVRDNGIGIEPQYFERIFQVFQRLHTRREYKGTGIGLAICKKIIERHGGRIWVESEVGQGTTFYFTLPKGK